MAAEGLEAGAPEDSVGDWVEEDPAAAVTRLGDWAEAVTVDSVVDSVEEDSGVVVTRLEDWVVVVTVDSVVDSEVEDSEAVDSQMHPAATVVVVAEKVAGSEAVATIGRRTPSLLDRR